MMNDLDDKHKSQSSWAGRSLPNYKAMHRVTAEKKGLSREFENARTLTEAKKILWGYKKKNQR